MGPEAVGVVRRRAAPGSARLAAAALCLGAFGAAAARARDIVYLRNGRFLEGEVTEETEDRVVLRVGKGVLRLRRSDVRSVERVRELPEWEARRRRELAEETRARGEAARAAAEKAEAEKKEAETREDEERIARLVEGLASEDAETRREAAVLLEGEGKKAVPALAGALFHGSAFAREAAARLLGTLGAREAVRAMIVALRSAVPETEKIRPWQRGFVRVLRSSLAATTGQDFGVSLYGTHQGPNAEKYVAWWDGELPPEKPEDPGKPSAVKGACLTWDTPQVGEEEIPEDDPEREKKLHKARRIGDERHSYSPPRAFRENPFGEAPEEE